MTLRNTTHTVTRCFHHEAEDTEDVSFTYSSNRKAFQPRSSPLRALMSSSDRLKSKICTTTQQQGHNHVTACCVFSKLVDYYMTQYVQHLYLLFQIFNPLLVPQGGNYLCVFENAMRFVTLRNNGNTLLYVVPQQNLPEYNTTVYHYTHM